MKWGLRFRRSGLVGKQHGHHEAGDLWVCRRIGVCCCLFPHSTRGTFILFYFFGK